VEVCLAAVTELGAAVSVSSAKASSRAVKGTTDTVHRGGHSANLEDLGGFLEKSVSVDDAIRGSADIIHTKDWAGMAQVAVAAETRKKALESILMLVWLFEADGVQGKTRCFQGSRELRADETRGNLSTVNV
jgi:ornithine carbamoyltransferase